jgi:hypothetical protein
MRGIMLQMDIQYINIFVHIVEAAMVENIAVIVDVR